MLLVSPLPSPDADRLIAELKLPEAAVVIFVVPELPRLIVNDVGEAETVNATGFDEVTVSVIVAVCRRAAAGARHRDRVCA